MNRFDLSEMSCRHCAAAIRMAVTAADPSASVDCDLNVRIVSLKSAFDSETLVSEMKEAGYDVTEVAAA